MGAGDDPSLQVVMSRWLWYERARLTVFGPCVLHGKRESGHGRWSTGKLNAAVVDETGLCLWEAHLPGRCFLGALFVSYWEEAGTGGA